MPPAKTISPKTAKLEPRRKRGRPAVDFSARSHILMGAATAFVKQGYARSSVETICKAANVSRATFYRFFPSKEEVFENLFDVGTSMLYSAVSAAIAGAKLPVDKVEAGLETYIRMQAGSSALAREFMIEALRPNSSLSARYRETMERFGQMLAVEYSAVRKTKIDPFLLEGLVAAMERVLFLLGTQTKGLPADIERCKRVLLRLVIATLSEGEPVPPIPTLK